MADNVRLRVRSKGKLISSKVIPEEDFKDYLAMAGSIASLSNAPDGIVKDIAYHTKAIDAVVVLSNGSRIQITLQRVKDKK